MDFNLPLCISPPTHVFPSACCRRILLPHSLPLFCSLENLNHTYLLPVFAMDIYRYVIEEPKEVLCGMSVGGMSNMRRRRGCGCFTGATGEAAVLLPESIGNYSHYQGRHLWGECQEGGWFWCDQISEAHFQSGQRRFH